METLKMIGLLIGFIVVMLGIISIFDARKLTEKWFSFHDKNEGARWLKVGGFAITIIGVLMIYFSK